MSQTNRPHYDPYRMNRIEATMDRITQESLESKKVPGVQEGIP